MMWQYITEKLDLEKWNRLGRDGWELVSVTEVFNSQDAQTETWGYFKRIAE
jgi:hypothetical protein